jgi:hypothetical protein
MAVSERIKQEPEARSVDFPETGRGGQKSIGLDFFGSFCIKTKRTEKMKTENKKSPSVMERLSIFIKINTLLFMCFFVRYG